MGSAQLLCSLFSLVVGGKKENRETERNWKRWMKLRNQIAIFGSSGTKNEKRNIDTKEVDGDSQKKRKKKDIRQRERINYIKKDLEKIK